MFKTLFRIAHGVGMELAGTTRSGRSVLNTEEGALGKEQFNQIKSNSISAMLCLGGTIYLNQNDETNSKRSC